MPQEMEESEKPKIPPRMKKKKGPERPAKPPHLRVPPSSASASPVEPIGPPSQNAPARDKEQHVKTSHPNTSSATPSSNGTSKASIMDKFLSQYLNGPASKREVLVAASKGGRERPVERRQREPAKLLTPTSSPIKPEESDEDSDASLRLVHPRTPVNPSHPKESHSSRKGDRSSATNTRSSRHPVILIPRGHPALDTKNLWGASFMPYSMWVQKSGSGDPKLCGNSGWFGQVFGIPVDPRGHVTHKIRHSSRDAVGTHAQKAPKSSSSTSGTSAKARSNSVTRSGSLTSHGSTSSDSGNETFPKSVLKKHKRNVNKNPAQSDQKKKNVTFNAFATVQLMEE